MSPFMSQLYTTVVTYSTMKCFFLLISSNYYQFQGIKKNVFPTPHIISPRPESSKKLDIYKL
ncbi:hypothetical protein M153_3060004460 [Pseudoloma neurophilia]|uniref:Uncharacterized protein n=1 Tax=Pseudoloma neurophilia TaxID=146866 RepID=A0A0R0LYA9_9MICR|nr:hypothetical protein M153_3060004460 [Pseudoloma neurophilia]